MARLRKPRLRKPRLSAQDRLNMVLRSYKYTGKETDWSTAAWVSHRYRTIIRLLAIEQMCRERGAGVLPDKVVEALELVTDFKGAHDKKYYVGRAQHLHVRGPISGAPVPPGELAFRRLMDEVQRFKRS